MVDLSCAACPGVGKAQMPRIARTETPIPSETNAAQAPTNNAGPNATFQETIGRTIATG